jgi:hypothetical protein
MAPTTVARDTKAARAVVTPGRVAGGGIADGYKKGGGCHEEAIITELVRFRYLCHRCPCCVMAALGVSSGLFPDDVCRTWKCSAFDFRLLVLVG